MIQTSPPRVHIRLNTPSTRSQYAPSMPSPSPPPRLNKIQIRQKKPYSRVTTLKLSHQSSVTVTYDEEPHKLEISLNDLNFDLITAVCKYRNVISSRLRLIPGKHRNNDSSIQLLLLQSVQASLFEQNYSGPVRFCEVSIVQLISSSYELYFQVVLWEDTTIIVEMIQTRYLIVSETRGRVELSVLDRGNSETIS